MLQPLVVFLVLAGAGPVKQPAAAPTPAPAPAEQPAAQPAPPPADQPAATTTPTTPPVDERADDPPPKTTGKHPAEEAEAEELDTEPKGNALLAGVVGGVAACLVVPVVGIALTLAAFVSIIPVIGGILALILTVAQPFIMGGVMGAVGWLAGSLVGKKRIPMLPLIAAGMAGIVITYILEVPAAVLMLVGYAVAYSGVLIATLGIQQSASLAGLGAAAAALGFVIFGVSALVSVLIAIAGYVTTSSIIGVLAGMLGRGTVEGESAIAWDVVSVPPPGEDDDADDADEDDRPKKHKKKQKKEKTHKALEDDDDEEEAVRPAAPAKKTPVDDEEAPAADPSKAY